MLFNRIYSKCDRPLLFMDRRSIKSVDAIALCLFSPTGRSILKLELSSLW
ncbi:MULTISPECIES: hypothetical protein [unclassified Microcoleus]